MTSWLTTYAVADYCFARAAPYLAPGVVLAVVDPGVGGPRRAIGIEVGDGSSILVGPDNGLLAPVVALCGGATAAVELTNPAYHLAPPSATFAGRDVFAPAAAHLCLGVPLHEFGPAIDVHSLTPGLMPVARVEADALHTEVLWIDRFGNAQLNVDAEDLAPLGPTLQIRCGETTRRAIVAPTYSSIPSGIVGAVIDSAGLVSLCVDRGHAADDLRLAVGDPVRIERRDGEAVVTPVQLQRR